MLREFKKKRKRKTLGLVIRLRLEIHLPLVVRQKLSKSFKFFVFSAAERGYQFYK